MRLLETGYYLRISCMMLDRSHSFSDLQFPHLQNIFIPCIYSDHQLYVHCTGKIALKKIDSVCFGRIHLGEGEKHKQIITYQEVCRPCYESTAPKEGFMLLSWGEEYYLQSGW